MNPVLTFVWKHKTPFAAALLAVLLCIGSFAFGRSMVPPAEIKETIKYQTVEVEKLVEKVVEKKVYIADKSQKIHRTEREIKHQDGSVETVKIEDINTDTKVNSSEERVVEKIVEKIVEVEVEKLVEVSKPQPDWRVGPLVGANIPQLPSILTGFDPLKQMSFGVQVERRILGPFSVGGFGLSTGQVGVSATMEF